MLLSDKEIIDQTILHPAVAFKVKDLGPSYGISSYGYDIRLGKEFIVWKKNTILDTKNINPNQYQVFNFQHANTFRIEPGQFILGTSLEYFRMPPNVTGLVKDKSTYARCGIAVQNTVIEAGWEGNLTLEITNHNHVSVDLIIGAGIAQVLFWQSQPCLATYSGKYQGQQGVTAPK